jgi:hypothetical protein
MVFGFFSMACVYLDMRSTMTTNIPAELSGRRSPAPVDRAWFPQGSMRSLNQAGLRPMGKADVYGSILAEHGTRCIPVLLAEDEVEVAEIDDDWKLHLREAFTSFSSGIDESIKQSRLTILEHRVTQLESVNAAVIASFAPEPVCLLKSIPVTIRQTGDDFIATFFDARLSSSGDNREDAFDNLKDIIVSTFQIFSSMSSDTMGPLPKRQMAVLSEFMKLEP